MATPTPHIVRADEKAVGVGATGNDPAIYPSRIQERPTPKDPSKERQPLQMNNIAEYTENDVLCGRGGAVLRHPGNVKYQNSIKERQTEYTTCLKAEKLHISRSIVEKVRNDFAGRFLVRDSRKLWNDIGDKKAIEKTSQALREGQPKRWETIRAAKAKAVGIVHNGIVLKGNRVKHQNGFDDNASTHSDDASHATAKSRTKAFLKGLSKELHPSDVNKSKKRKEARKKKSAAKIKSEGSSQQQISTSSLSYASSYRTDPSKRTVYSADTISSSNASLSVQRTISSSMASMSVNPTINSSNASLSVNPTISSSNASLSVQHTISTMSFNPTITSSNASLSINPTICSSNASLSLHSSNTGEDSWGPLSYERQDSNCSTLVTGNLDNQGRVEKIEYLLPRRTSEFTVDLTDADLMHLGEIPEYNDESHPLAPERFQHNNYSKNAQSFRRRMSHKASPRGSLNTLSSSGRGAQSLLSEFSAIGSKMSIMTKSSTDSSSPGLTEIKPVTIWNANESGMPIPVPNEIPKPKQQQHSKDKKIDRRKMFASMKGKKRNRSAGSGKKPPLSTLILNSDLSESKEQPYYRGTSYKDSLGSLNTENIPNLRTSFHSKTLGTSNHSRINQSTRSGMSALTMMSIDSIGTSIDLLSVCDVLQSSSKSDVNSGGSGSKERLHEMPVWNSNRSGFSGPPISILTRPGPSEVNTDTWVSRNTLNSKDSFFSSSTNSKGSISQLRRALEGKSPVGVPGAMTSRRNSIKSKRSNMSKALSDLSMGTGFGTSNLSIASFNFDELEDMLPIDDSLVGQPIFETNGGKKPIRNKLPSIEGSKADFDFSPMEMDVD